MNVMWQYSTGTRQQLPPQLFEQMGHYRREVFINQLGWGLNTVNGMELDEFDGPDAVYVCSHDEDGQVSGVARLLPTTAPYLMEKVFPELWGGKQIPRDPKVWELSRFAAVSRTPSVGREHQATAEHASELLRNVMRVASLLGAQTLVTVSPVGMERLLRLNGFRAKRAGTVMKCDLETIVSLVIESTLKSQVPSIV
jgi:N-acyl-L-homoserine lactone synthetase